MFRIRGRQFSLFVVLFAHSSGPYRAFFYNYLSYFTGKNNPILYSGAEMRQKPTQTTTGQAQTISNFERV